MNRIARIVLQPGNFIVEGIQAPIQQNIRQLDSRLVDEQAALLAEQTEIARRLGDLDVVTSEQKVMGTKAAREQMALLEAERLNKEMTEQLLLDYNKAKQVELNTIDNWNRAKLPLNLTAYGLYASPAITMGISNSYNDMVNEELRQRQRAVLAQQGVYPR